MKHHSIPEGRLAGLAYRQGHITMTIIQGALSGRMATVRVRIDPNDEILMERLIPQVEHLADYLQECLHAASRARADLHQLDMLAGLLPGQEDE